MAEAHKCDRCKRFYSEDDKRPFFKDVDNNKFNAKQIYIVGDGRYEIEGMENIFHAKSNLIDLCPDCMYALIRWLKERPKGVHKNG